MAIILTSKKNGKGWYSNEMLRIKDVEEVDVNNIPNATLEKKYFKIVKKVGDNPDPEIKEGVEMFRSYINRRYREGIYIFLSKREKKTLSFCYSLV